MNLGPQSRRLAILGVALALTLASAGWLFFGTREEDAAAVLAAAAPAAAAVVAGDAPAAAAAVAAVPTGAGPTGAAPTGALATVVTAPAAARAAAAKSAGASEAAIAAAAATPAATPGAPHPARASDAPVRARVDVVGASDTSSVAVVREVFAYGSGGRRDPFRPLITTSVLRPLPSELRLVGVAYDPQGAGSVAILRDITTKEQHRVRAGQLLGRMRVARIRPKDVVFTIEELGFSRQEILGLQDSSATRLP